MAGKIKPSLPSDKVQGPGGKSVTMDPEGIGPLSSQLPSPEHTHTSKEQVTQWREGWSSPSPSPLPSLPST